jgi:peptidoglycan/LPS O-acetylase OafA/YrhL
MTAPTLRDFKFKSNSIGFLRLLFALVVVWSHAYSIGGLGADPIVWLTRGVQSAGTLAVGGFFVLSGFLIARSYENARSLAIFLWHRFLRIFPGYWVCLALTAFVIVPVMLYARHDSMTAEYFHNSLTYVARNALLINVQLTVGSVIKDLPEANTINGSLWTLPVEFACYLLIGAFGVVGLLGKSARLEIFALLGCLFAIAFCDIRGINPGTPTLQALALFAYFLAGACLYTNRKIVPIRPWLAVAALLGAAISLYVDPAGVTLILFVSYLVLYVSGTALCLNFDRTVDLSYGVYIYAFPVQQLLVTMGVERAGFLGFFFLTLAVTIPTAFLSWILVEKPCLSLKNVGAPSMR